MQRNSLRERTKKQQGLQPSAQAQSRPVLAEICDQNLKTGKQVDMKRGSSSQDKENCLPDDPKQVLSNQRAHLTALSQNRPKDQMQRSFGADLGANLKHGTSFNVATEDDGMAGPQRHSTRPDSSLLREDEEEESERANQGRTVTSQMTAPRLNHQSSQVEYFLSCARQRWLTACEYSNLLLHWNKLAPLLDIQVLQGNQHPNSIYYMPQNGMLYFLKDVQDIKRLGFPPITHEKQKGTKLSRVNTKFICWKRMNFVTRLPKCDPKVEYIVASGRSSKFKLDFEASSGTTSLTDCYYRMHIVWLSKKTAQSANLPQGQTTVLCHILQVTGEVETQDLQSGEELGTTHNPSSVFDGTSGHNLPKKQYVNSHLRSPSELMFTKRLGKRKPQARKDLQSQNSPSVMRTPVVQQRTQGEVGGVTESAKPQTPPPSHLQRNPMVFKWRSVSKQPDSESGISNWFKVFGFLQTGSNHNPADANSQHPGEPHELREVRRVLFDCEREEGQFEANMQPNTTNSNSLNDGRETSQTLFQTASQALLHNKGAAGAQTSDYKQMLKIEGDIADRSALRSFSYLDWSPSCRIPNQHPGDHASAIKSYLDSNSKDYLRSIASIAKLNMQQSDRLREGPSQHRNSSEIKNGSFGSQSHQLPLRHDATPQSALSPNLAWNHVPFAQPQNPSHLTSFIDHLTPSRDQFFSTPVRGLSDFNHIRSVERPIMDPEVLRLRDLLVQRLSCYHSIDDWLSDPNIMEAFANYPVLLLRIDDELQDWRRDESNTQTYTAKKNLVTRRLEAPEFTDYLRSLTPATAHTAVLPPHLVCPLPSDSIPALEVKLEDAIETKIEDSGFDTTHDGPGMNQTDTRGTPQTHPAVKIEETWPTERDLRGESQYSQFVRVMYAKRLLAMSKGNLVRKRN